jgi:hypothetical protein
MSIWSVLLAAQGFEYNGPKQAIGFNPVWQPENHVSFFTTAEGWGNFSQTTTGNVQQNSIELAYGKLALSTINLVVDNEATQNASVSLNGQKVNSSFKTEGNRVTIDFNEMNLLAGDKIEVRLE